MRAWRFYNFYTRNRGWIIPVLLVVPLLLLACAELYKQSGTYKLTQSVREHQKQRGKLRRLIIYN
jgi:uncharacterized membrane protein YGL010W